ncbi:hypothetical protein RTBOTA2_006805 [Rhodotorula toruloides]|nr:hypothetical protein RTBOTA2_006805 [Rhodotorula toruloides]
MRSGGNRSTCFALLPLLFLSHTNPDELVEYFHLLTAKQRMSRAGLTRSLASIPQRLLSYTPSSSVASATPKAPNAANELRPIEDREREREREKRLEEDIREAWVWGVW